MIFYLKKSLIGISVGFISTRDAKFYIIKFSEIAVIVPTDLCYSFTSSRTATKPFRLAQFLMWG